MCRIDKGRTPPESVRIKMCNQKGRFVRVRASEAGIRETALMSGNLADLPLNCPKCGRPMLYLHVPAADGRIIDVATARGE